MRTLIYCFFLCITFNSFAQLEISTKLGLSSLNEIQIDIIERDTARNTGFYSSMSYLYQSYGVDESTCSIGFPTFAYNGRMSGFAIKLGVNYKKVKRKRGKEKIIYRTTAFFYKRFSGQQVIRHCSFFGSGGGSSLYEVKSNEVGIYTSRERQISKGLYWYYALGVSGSILKKEEMIELTNPEISQEPRIRFIFDIGIRFNFLKF